MKEKDYIYYAEAAIEYLSHAFGITEHEAVEVIREGFLFKYSENPPRDVDYIINELENKFV